MNLSFQLLLEVAPEFLVGFFRTALLFWRAAKLMFSPYGADVCRQANPAGVIGICDAMSCGVRKRDVLYDEELRSLRDL